MLKELNHIIDAVEMKITKKDMGVTRATRTMSYAKTFINGTVGAQYHQNKGVSTVWTNVDVEAGGDGCWSLDAVIRVEITYEGNIEQATQEMMDQAEFRLEELAQGHCMNEVRKEVFGK